MRQRTVRRVWSVVTTMCAVWLASTAPSCAYGQITIIPQERVREAASPTIVEGKPMVLDNEGVISFGTIGEDDGAWQGEITWRSNEDKPLTITRITSSCGCLKVHWDRREATNAKEGSLKVEYHPKGHPGKVEQRLFVYTTLSERRPTAIVRVVGTVTPSSDKRGNYPHAIATLRLRQREVTLPSDGGKVSIAIINGGSGTLRITHDRSLSMGGIEAHTVPAELLPGQEGDLVINYSPKSDQPPILYLKGINAAPRERKIEIRIEE